MEKIPWNQSDELAKQEDFKEKLSELEGFKNLSEQQQQYLETTFYIQQRAERGTDIGSAQSIHEVPLWLQEEGASLEYTGKYISTSHVSGGSDYIQGINNNYEKSQRFIMSENCHRVIRKLESYARNKSSEETWLDYGSIHSYEDLCESLTLILEKERLPLVIKVFDNKEIPVHTSLFLGYDNENNPIVWEKKGYNMQFHIATLELIYNTYKEFSNWKFRTLKT